MGKCEKLLFMDRNYTRSLNDDDHFGSVAPYENPFLLLLAVFLVVTNFALIFGLRKANKKMTISQKLYVYLSLNDAIVGLVCLPALVTVNITKKRSCKIENIIQLVINYPHITGTGIFCMISILRNMAIRKPLVKPSPKKVITALILWNLFVVGIRAFLYL